MLVISDKEQPQETSILRFSIPLTLKDRGEVSNFQQKSGETIKPREFPQSLTGKICFLVFFKNTGVFFKVEHIFISMFY